ncbi:ribosome maturation factor RimP [Corynebacterium pacaense]|uniref:ribosome maturation factor RimP n=1 Tax=Corynebacterium pacaense TaxID=1816684 RepID=UPI0009BC3CF2|nr:ribosome maturation factor RimP [Corynebacterium pacaense]
MAFPSSEELDQLVTPIAAAHGLDVEALKVNKAGPKSAVSIKLDSDDRADLDRLEVVSRQIGEFFDAEEAAGRLNFGAGYTLEVSTPGVEMPLTAARHWRRNRGRLVALGTGAETRIARIGALNEQESAVILIERRNRELVTSVLQLADAPLAVVEIEFANPAQEEMTLAEATFDDVVGI